MSVLDAFGSPLRDEMQAKSRAFATEQIERQKKDFQRLGVLGDWENPYLTMAYRNEADEIRVLGKLLQNGYIYRGLKPVNWCFDCGSALAEAELPERDRENAFVARLWATQRVGYLSAERRRNGASAEIDDEIRTLGEKYGIPTELTSYLVLEPGHVIARRGQIGDLRGVASTGNAAPRVQAFEEAKAASAMRGAQTLAQAEAAAPPVSRGGISSRRVGTRTFVLRDSVWTDARFTEGTRLVTVKAYSEAYFALVRELPDLAAAFALGERVLVRGTNVDIAQVQVQNRVAQAEARKAARAAAGRERAAQAELRREESKRTAAARAEAAGLRHTHSAERSARAQGLRRPSALRPAAHSRRAARDPHATERWPPLEHVRDTQGF